MYSVSLLRNCNPASLRRYLGLSGVVRALDPAYDPAKAKYSLEPFIRTRSIFVHIPKAAGVSVARGLYGNMAFGHRKLCDYKRIFRPAIFDAMYKFTIVRNPFDRLHSAYSFLKTGGMSAADQEFSDLVLSAYPDFRAFVLDGLHEQRVQEYFHFIPQHDFLVNQDGNLADIDFVGRFETLSQDFALISEQVNPAAQLKHENKSTGRERGDYRRHYTPEMVDRVSAVYGKCMQLLDYGFDPVSKEAAS